MLRLHIHCRLLFLILTLIACSSRTVGTARAQLLTPPEGQVKVAFIGDVGVRDTSEKVLALVKNEGAQLLVIVGDFDYEDSPAKFFDMVYQQSGGTIPILVVIGNHDQARWGGTTGYQAKFFSKLKDFPNVHCTGDFGINGTCTYKGVTFLLSGVGTLGKNHDQYLSSQLTASNSVWNVCLWHVAVQTLQVGEKTDMRHLPSYEICRQAGAPIITAHEHSYHRTKTLTDMNTRTVSAQWPTANSLAVGPGFTFVSVTGAGGESLREQKRCLPSTEPYSCTEWAKLYTTSQGAAYGAQFITFGEGGPGKATGYFKNIAGEVVDRFTITNTRVAGSPPATPTPPSIPTPLPSPTPPSAPVRGDFNGDRLVNLLDYQKLVLTLHTTQATYSLVAPDNYVDLYDYNEFLKLVH
jgi:predicted phosphodiesterase